MSTSISKRRVSRPTRKPAQRSVRQQHSILEPLEGRSLYSVAPGVPVRPVVPVLPATDLVGDTIATARSVDVRASPRQTVSDLIDRIGDVDFYRVALRQGEALVADVDPRSLQVAGTTVLPGVAATSLAIFDSAGHELARSATLSPEPDTGILNQSASTAFYAPLTGNYYVKVATPTTQTGGYSLELRRTGLADSRPSAAALRQAGALSASLNGDVLYLAGPTGYGFALRGNWTKTTTRQVSRASQLFSANYAATGTLQLQTPFGELPLSVKAGQTLSVSTAANGYGNIIGDVSSITGSFGLPFAQYAQAIAPLFGLNVDAAGLGDQWSIRMGSAIHADVPQALEGVPYLFYGERTKVVASFGDATVTTGDTDSTIIAADPSDPFLYVRAGNFTFAGSRNGSIPFVASTSLPAGSPGPFFGHVYAEGEFPLAKLPLEAVGRITVDLDANDDGVLLAGKGNASQLFRGDLFRGTNLNAVLSDINVGVSGGVNLGYHFGQWNLTIPLGEASAVYSGPKQGVWFSGRIGPKDDPFAGTSLAVLKNVNSSSTTRFEGYILRNGTFRVSGTNTYQVLGARADLTLSLTNLGIHAQGTLKALGATANVSGDFFANLDYKLRGEATVDWGAIKGGATVEVSRTGLTSAFFADVHAGFRASAAGFSARADATGRLNITYPLLGTVRYSGSIRLSGSVSAPIVGKVASISTTASVSNNRLRFSISKIGSVTVNIA